MEACLVRALAEMVPSAHISIIKSGREKFLGGLEKLLTEAGHHNGGNYQVEFDDEPQGTLIKKHLEACRATKQTVAATTREGASCLLIPILSNGKLNSVLALESQADVTGLQPLLEGIIGIYSNYLSVLDQSERDKLTDLLNRRTFDSKLSRLLQLQELESHHYESSLRKHERRSVASDAHAWLAIMDIDFLKEVNDRYGHLCGDKVIVTLAEKMKSFFRSSDLLFRFGGEEFLVVLEPIPLHTAEHALNQFREIIAKHEFPQAGQITISIGFAKITDQDYPPYIIDNADKALYFAKGRARNCVYNYETLVAEGLLAES